MPSSSENDSVASNLQRWATLLSFVCALFVLPRAHALPSFAQQTNQPCAACHVGAYGPQLTAFGRDFKLGGYTLKVGEDTKIPIAAMLVASNTHTSKDQSEPAGPHDGTNDNSSLQELSLFYAGRISDHLGAFAQATYSDIDRKVALDNVDVRYARPFTYGDGGGTYGFTVNNNPTVQDAWNTQPAWRFPYMASELAPAPGASPLLAGGLEQGVIGATAYVYLNHAWYGEAGFYKSLSTSFLDKVNAGDPGRIQNAAPYWRFVWNHDLDNQNFSLGLTGLDAKIRDSGANSGPSNRFRDVGFDASWQYNVSSIDILTANASFIHESQSLGASYAAGDAEHRHGSLRSGTLDASWYHDATWGATFAYFDTRGSRDADLYAAEPDSGSAAGRPDSRGTTYQVDWTPWGKADSWLRPFVNARIGIQYTAYSKFNGARRNYDGFGRNASDNNTLFTFLWTAF